MANFSLNLRSASSSTPTPIHLIVRWNNNKLVIHTKEKIHPKYWKAKEQLVSSKYVGYSEFNSRLKNIITDSEDAFRRFKNDNKHVEPTLAEFREILSVLLHKKTEEKLDLFKFIDLFIEESKTKVNQKTNKVFSKSIIGIYERCKQLLIEYRDKKNKVVDFDTIDMNFYKNFTAFLMEKKFSLNTIGKQIKTLKTFMNDATYKGINTNLGFKNKDFYVMTEDVENIYLNKDELEELYNLDLTKNERLERVRDMFIVGCWTGLRFSDFSRIEAKNIDNDFLEIKTKKTAEPVVIPIHPNLKEIMNKYKGVTDNSLPPSISNAKMNEYLKELGKLVEGMNQKVSKSTTIGGKEITKNYFKHELIMTHTARRSFASNLYLDKIPTITIRQLTGHKTEKSFLKYIKIKPKEHAEFVLEHWRKSTLLKAV